MTPGTTTTEVQRRLKEAEELVRKEIQKELKIKEGAEKLRQAKSGGKSDINAEIKRLNARLEELNQDLQEIQTFQLMISDGSTPFSTPSRQPGFMQHLHIMLSTDLPFLCGKYGTLDRSGN